MELIEGNLGRLSYNATYAMEPNFRLPEHFQEPTPDVDTLGRAWKTTFANLAVFVPLGLLQIAASVLFGGLILGISYLLGFPFSPDEQTDLQWLSEELFWTGVMILVIGPIYAVSYDVVFKVLDRHPSPLSSLQFGKHYSNAVVYFAITGVIGLFVSIACRYSIPRDYEAYATMVISGLITLPLFLTVPAMVRFGLTPFKAMQFSWERFLRRPLSYLGFVIAAEAMSICGVFACCFGVIFTISVYMVATAMLVWPIGTRDDTSPWFSNSEYPRYPGEPPSI